MLSLSYCTEEIGGNVDFHNNKLISLEYCPKSIGEDFIVSENHIEKFDYDNFPKKIGGIVYCAYNSKSISEYDYLEGRDVIETLFLKKEERDLFNSIKKDKKNSDLNNYKI